MQYNKSNLITQQSGYIFFLFRFFYTNFSADSLHSLLGVQEHLSSETWLLIRTQICRRIRALLGSVPL